MSAEQFVKAHAAHAKAAQDAFGVPALVALAQSALETGWGAKAPGNNFFGIRADASWHGPVVAITTHEVLGGISELQHGQAFRAYASPAESFADWGLFLVSMPRYKRAFSLGFHHGLEITHAKAFARSIAAAGYATAPNYADQLCAMIDSVKKRMPA